MTSSERAKLERLLTPRVLRLLIELEDRGGVGAAARAIDMTQPSASRAITGIEAELGYRLLRRTPLGSTLTSQGAALVSKAREVVAEYGQLCDLARNFNPELPTDIRIAASRTVGEHLVPGWLGAIAREIPQVRVAFHVDNSEAVIAEVLNEQVTMGFVETPMLPAAIEQRVLLHDQLVVIAPPGASSLPPKVSAPELAGVQLVEREPGSGTRAMLDELLPERLEPVAQFDSNTAIVQAVAAGVGPAVLSELAVGEAVESGKVRAIAWAAEPPQRPLRAIWRADVGLTDLGQRILQLVSNG